MGSMEVALPRRDSEWPTPVSEKPASQYWGTPSLYMRSSPRIDSGPRELFGVGMGVAAVRIIIGGAIMPRGSMWPLAVIIREYIFSSAEEEKYLSSSSCLYLALTIKEENQHYLNWSECLFCHWTHHCLWAVPPSRPPQSSPISFHHLTPTD